MPFTVEPENGASSCTDWNLVVPLVGLIVIFAVGTSKLVLAEGVLTATNFGVSRSMPLDEVEDVDLAMFAWFGMKIRRKDRSGIRTLVSGTSGDEWWTPRAEKIARSIVEAAEQHGREQARAADAAPPRVQGS